MITRMQCFVLGAIIGAGAMMYLAMVHEQTMERKATPGISVGSRWKDIPAVPPCKGCPDWTFDIPKDRTDWRTDLPGISSESAATVDGSKLWEDAPAQAEETLDEVEWCFDEP